MMACSQHEIPLSIDYILISMFIKVTLYATRTPLIWDKVSTKFKYALAAPVGFNLLSCGCADTNESVTVASGVYFLLMQCLRTTIFVRALQCHQILIQY